jgi:hypothetical protein
MLEKDVSDDGRVTAMHNLVSTQSYAGNRL